MIPVYTGLLLQSVGVGTLKQIPMGIYVCARCTIGFRAPSCRGAPVDYPEICRYGRAADGRNW
jgi:hypothetical protein